MAIYIRENNKELLFFHCCFSFSLSFFYFSIILCFLKSEFEFKLSSISDIRYHGAYIWCLLSDSHLFFAVTNLFKKNTFTLYARSMFWGTILYKYHGTYIRWLLRYRCARICYLSCFKHLFRSRAVTNLIFFFKNGIFSFMPAQHVLSYHLIYICTMLSALRD